MVIVRGVMSNEKRPTRQFMQKAKYKYPVPAMAIWNAMFFAGWVLSVMMKLERGC